MNSRKSVELSERFKKRWLGYAAAAGAAAAGMLTPAQPAKADIIYTPANIVIPPGGGSGLPIDGSNFEIFNTHGFSCLRSSCAFFHLYNVVRIESRSGLGGVAGTYIFSGGRRFLASRLPAGAAIGANRKFVGSSLVFSNDTPYSLTYVGQWRPSFGAVHGYLGLEMEIDGQPHYGWAAVQVYRVGTYPDQGFDCVVEGYAYDTVAGETITAGEGKTPEPGTLGLLALGSLGLGYWRRRKAVGSKQ